MLKKTIIAAAAVAAISTGAIATTSAPAEAGAKFHFHVGGYGPHWGGGVWVPGPGYYGNPCRHWKRKFHRTGRYRFLRKYKRCMRYAY